MQNDESIKYNIDKIQQEKLDAVLTQVLETLEASRGDIYEITEECHKRCENIRGILEKTSLETTQIIEKVDEVEILEKNARWRLMQVSQNFTEFSEDNIKQAYEQAQEKQSELQSLRQMEKYLRQQRDELILELRRLEGISIKADNYLHNTRLALRILQGNVERLNTTLEDAYKKQQVSMWILETMDCEQRKIARELHDGPAQTLASMLIRIDLIEYLCEEDLGKVREELNDLRSIGRESLDDVRRIMFDLKPSAVREIGLVDTLKDYFVDYENKYSFEIEFVHFGKYKKYDLPIEVALFRMVQEALTNVRKHAGVNKALVKMEESHSGLILVVKDEGRGFAVKEISNLSNAESYGILGMRERAELIGGRVEILSSPGSGTQVIIEVPTEGEERSGKDKGFTGR